MLRVQTYAIVLPGPDTKKLVALMRSLPVLERGSDEKPREANWESRDGKRDKQSIINSGQETKTEILDHGGWPGAF